MFDEIFSDVAKRESLSIELTGAGGRALGNYVFRELYCSRPRCDCKTVTCIVIELETRQTAAIIHYAFGATDRSREPFLDPTGPRDVRAEKLLQIFVGELENGFDATIVHHYAAWRSAVDDRKHAAHGLVASRRGGSKTKRTPPRRREKAPAPATGVEIVIAERARGADNKAQKRFTTHVRKVEGLRARVKAWHDQRPAIDRGLALYQAEFATQRELAKQFVEGLDKLLVDGVVPKKSRAKLQRLVCSVAIPLIEDGHDDLKAIHDRHSKSSYDKEASAAESDAVSSIKAMMEVMGLDLGDDVRSMDDVAAVMEREREKLREEDATAAQRRSSRKKTRKQLERETAAEAQQRDASKVLQDVYRKLAQALHPDLERDDVERARKTSLMQDVNAAYVKKDLLRLLELQLKFEKIDENARDIAEERLVHYTRILEQQARELTSELDDLELPWRVQLDRPPPARIAPNDVLAALHRDTEDLRETIVMQREDLVAINDPKRLQAWLRTVPDPRSIDQELPF